MNKKAAILTNRLLDWHTAKLAVGGGERYTLQLCDLLIDLGYDVTVYQVTMTLPYTIQYKNITVVGLQPKSLIHLEREVCDDFHRKTGDCSIHIITMPEYAYGRLHDGTIVTAQGSVWWARTPDNLDESDKRALDKVIASSSAFVTIHSYIKDVIKRVAPRHATKVEVIEHGIDTDSFKPTTPPLVRRKVAIFPGRAEIMKGTEIYKEVWRLHQRSDLVETWGIGWVGDGGQYDSLESAIRVPQSMMPAIYQSSKICCVVSADKGNMGTPLTLLEGMASGCACISLKGTEDVIKDGINGISIEDNDPISVYSAIRTLMEDEALINIYGQTARETILNRFSMKLWKERWTKVISNNQKKVGGLT